MKKMFSVLFISSVLFIAIGCGGGIESSTGGVPTSGGDGTVTNVTGITSVTTPNASGVLTTLDSGNPATDIDPSSISIQFSSSVRDASVIAEGGVTVSCDIPVGNVVLAQPEIDVTAATAEKTFTVTMTDAYKYQLLKCILTLTTAIQDPNWAQYLKEAVEYTFTNGCAISDDFNVDSIIDNSCWQHNAEVGSFNSLISAVSTGFFGVDAVNSVFDVNLATSESTTYTVYKEVTIPDNDSFTIEIRYESAPNFIGTSGEAAGGILSNVLDFLGVQEGALYGVFRARVNICSTNGQVASVGEPGIESTVYGDDCTGDGPFYIRLLKVDGTFYHQYRTPSDNAFITLPTVDPGEDPWPDVDFGGNTVYLNIAGISPAGVSTASAQIDYIKVSGMESTTQY